MSYFRPLSGLFSAVTTMAQPVATAQQAAMASFATKYGADPHYADYVAGAAAVQKANVSASDEEIVAAVNKALAAGQPAAAAPAILAPTIAARAGAPAAPAGMSHLVLYGAAAAVGLGVLLIIKRKKKA